MTLPELILWRKLKTLRLQGIRFEAQSILLQKYIADFYLSSHRLVIEVDGRQHEEPRQAAKDRVRDAEMQAAGMTVLRFAASRVFKELDSVLLEITDQATKAIPDQQKAAEPGGVRAQSSKPRGQGSQGSETSRAS